MNDKKLFDKWSNDYDKEVKLSEAEDKYPFAAYEKILNKMVEISESTQGNRVLELGIGTGKLSKKLYDLGYEITGVDFSEEMLNKAKKLIPNGKFINWNFKDKLPKEILDSEYDIVLFSYSIHHLDYDSQYELIKSLFEVMTYNGRIIIGDVMAKNKDELDKLSELEKELWDDNEFYPVFSEIRSEFKDRFTSYYPLSYCSGVIVIRKMKNLMCTF